MSKTKLKAMVGIGLRHGLTGGGIPALAIGLQNGDWYMAGAGLLGTLAGLGLSWFQKKAAGVIEK